MAPGGLLGDLEHMKGLYSLCIYKGAVAISRLN
jgi:hypothetical protein